MSANKNFFDYLDDGVSFSSQQAAQMRLIYAPLCGIDSNSIKSAISPCLSGDIKVDKFHYLTRPVSREDLRTDLRQFFVNINGAGIISLTDNTTCKEGRVEIGQLWHRLVRAYATQGLELSALNFVPVSGERVELMRVSVKNISQTPVTFIPTVSVPIFGRALANKHDHEHVTALLNRIQQLPEGVLVEPTMAFNEEGHKAVHSVYYVFGINSKGMLPAGSFPTVESFYGEQANGMTPRAIVHNIKPCVLSSQLIDGKEAVGALQFPEETIAPGESIDYFTMIGVADSAEDALQTFQAFKKPDQWNAALKHNQVFWTEKSKAIEFQTGNANFNSWARWVAIQPVLRRIFGCSFLPDHDYGKGGKGWRDIWQDLLSLILIEPDHVRETLVNNFAGVRVDGSNATIIGSRPGEFIADRNVITRVWMDHGIWPFLTTLLYIDQTGDFDLLLEENTYFRDPQMSRTLRKDDAWKPSYGNKLKDKNGEIYKGTILEHILIENLVPFFNVGEHNLIRLENADWNDGLDMAFDRGESSAFTSMYAGNLFSIAQLLESLGKAKGVTTVRLLKEITILLDSVGPVSCDYNDVTAKKTLLFDHYLSAVEPELSGAKMDFAISDIVRDLRLKAQWIFDLVRRQEKITVQGDGRAFQWFNGYYDNLGHRVEGKILDCVRMTLTGQVFNIISGLAAPEDVKNIIESVNHFLKDKTLGGVRLNTDFGIRHYLELGRAFGFAYGTKENGAFFSHMNVMYAYGLYKRGFVREGYEVLLSIYRMANDLARAKIYPGVPEYFDSEGRGMYHYLTGSASWYVLTQLTQVFGVSGACGDLLLSPKLVKEEFSKDGLASVSCTFAGRELTVLYENPRLLDFGQWQIHSVNLNGRPVEFQSLSPTQLKIHRSFLNSSLKNQITIRLESL